MSLNKVLMEELERVKISPEEEKYLNLISKKTIASIEKKLKRKKIDASVFVGGSLAKGTIMKKKKYDIDIFVRFDKKYSEKQIKKLIRRVFWFFRIKGQKIRVRKLKGSRDYYKILFKKNKHVCIEVVPVLKIVRKEQARNVTDLSYLHVNYIKKLFKKKKKLVDEIILAEPNLILMGFQVMLWNY